MRSTRLLAVVGAFACLLSLADTARAQDPVTWSATSGASGPVRAGDTFTLKVTAQIAPGWHLYSLTQGAGGPIPTHITLPDGQPFALAGAVTGPRPRVEMDPNFQINTESHEGSVTFVVPVKAADAAPGQQQVNVSVRYQACNDTMCLPPRTTKLSAPVVLGPASAAAAPPAETPANTNAAQSAPPGPDEPAVDPAASTPLPSTPSPAAGTDPQPAMAAVGAEGSLWSFIWLAMTLGALSLLTPCVFPMVPITISYFTTHAAGNRAAAARDAVIYALGIILTFTALGVALAMLFGAAGINKFAANPWVNLVVTGIFLGFALSLFGAFDLGLPSSVLTKLDELSRNRESSKILGLLLMGLTFSLTSFTCTAPFVGTLLGMAAEGRWLYPVVGMLGFSSVFALPFFVLALAPQLVSQLPRAGGWLNSVKVVMGLLEVAAAMKFLSNADLIWRWSVFTREAVLASWVAVALVIAVYLLGAFQLSNDTKIERIGAARLMIALVSLAFGFYLLTGLFGARLGELESFLPPAAERASSSSPVAGEGELHWITNDYEGALERARAEGKPVFVDFTGYTCTNCRWMEANMFTRTPIKQELSKYVLVRLFTDGEGEPYEKQQAMQQERFGSVALPLYAVVRADGTSLASFPGLTRSEPEFLSFLKAGRAKA